MNFCRFVLHPSIECLILVFIRQLEFIQMSSILFSTFQFDRCIKYVFISFFVHVQSDEIAKKHFYFQKLKFWGIIQIPVIRCKCTSLIYQIGMCIISGLIIVCMQVKMSTVVNMEVASITCCAVSVESSVAAQPTLLLCRSIL